jgi:hypothetical protein
MPLLPLLDAMPLLPLLMEYPSLRRQAHQHLADRLEIDRAALTLLRAGMDAAHPALQRVALENRQGSGRVIGRRDHVARMVDRPQVAARRNCGWCSALLPCRCASSHVSAIMPPGRGKPPSCSPGTLGVILSLFLGARSRSQ